MPRLRFRLRHAFIALVAVAVLVSTFGSILDTLDFSRLNTDSHAEVEAKPVRARINSFQLASPTPSEPNAGPAVGQALQVVAAGQDLNFSLDVEGIKQVYVAARPASGARITEASGRPDSDGHVVVSLRLPETGSVYEVRAYGIVREKLIHGWQGGAYKEQPAVAAGTVLRVLAK